MTYPASPADAPASRVRPDSAQFWAGAVATAVVAALIALVGILVCRWTLHIPILAPAGEGAWGNAHTGEYALFAALIALVAAGVLYLLVLGTPQPRLFFNWIMGLATVAAVVYPFSSSAPLNQKGATAIVDLVLGLAIGSLLTAVAARAVRRVRTVRTIRTVPADRGYVQDPAYGRDQAYGRGQGYPAESGYPADQGYPVDQGYPADRGNPAGPGYPVNPGRPVDRGYPARVDEQGYPARSDEGYVPGQRPAEPTRPIGNPPRRGRRR